jgi:hypothetical protein
VRIGQVKELNMHKKVLAMALAGMALPALALASSPLLVRFEGHTVPVRETVQVRHLPSGTVRVRTYSWRGPNGAGTVEISEGPGARPAMPAWALAQMREMQMQMRQMRRIEAAFAQPLLAPSPPIRVMWSDPLLIRVPGMALPLETRVLEPLIVPQALLPMRVIAIVPRAAAPRAAPHEPARHRGLAV